MFSEIFLAVINGFRFFITIILSIGVQTSRFSRSVLFKKYRYLGNALRIIGENYTLYVLRPAVYDTTSVKLPVLYMTDGDWNMTVAMNCFSMLRQDYDTREPLIVGIGYGKGKNQRFRDLDPATGGPAFLTFIETEVMPFINTRYRTNKEKAIYGYSMGGMFTTYTLFNRPDLFDMVFIGAPGNSGGQLMNAARTYFKTHKELKSKVFIGVGSYEKRNRSEY
jgi:predicted alpha/beta superfamily hydrolase